MAKRAATKHAFYGCFTLMTEKSFPNTDSLPQHLAKAIDSMQQVASGHNPCYRCVTKQHHEWYWRQLPEEFFCNEFQVMFALNQNAETRVLVPEILHFDQSNGELLTAAVSGQVSDRKKVLTHAESLIRDLKIIHSARPVPTDRIWRLAELRQSLMQVSTLLTAEEYQQILWWTELVAQQLSSVEPELGLNHGDLTADNLRFEASSERWQWIDWEYSQYTDVRWDLASLAVEFELSDEEFESLLKLYNGAGDASRFIAGAYVWRQFYRLMCFCWALEFQQPSFKYWAGLESDPRLNAA